MKGHMQNNVARTGRGLASADEKTRRRVGRKGGLAHHELRGLQAADKETRERVAREGGSASRGGISSNNKQSIDRGSS
jgi:general stress protein YciG